MSSRVCVLEVWVELLSCPQVEVRAGLSDGSFVQLIRTDGDLARMMKRLVDGFPDDREMLSSHLLTGLLRIRDAEQTSAPEVKKVEVNKLLNTIVRLPHKFSQSEAVLAFFELSAEDQVFRRQDWTETQEGVQVSTLQEDLTFRPEEDQTFRLEEDQARGPEEDQTFRPEEDQTFRPETDQTFRPEEDQTFRPEEDQTFRPEEDQTFRPEKDQTFRPEEDQTFRLKKEQTRGPDEEETTIPEQTQIFRVYEDQDVNVFQSSVVGSEVLMANGFCLANTETILVDMTPPTRHVTQSEDSSGRRDDGPTCEEEAELPLQVDPSPSPLHLLLTWAQETDILD